MSMTAIRAHVTGSDGCALEWRNFDIMLDQRDSERLQLSEAKRVIGQWYDVHAIEFERVPGN